MLVYCVQGRSAKTERSKGKVFQGICFTDLFHLLKAASEIVI